jgi:hypothetical protein
MSRYLPAFLLFLSFLLVASLNGKSCTAAVPSEVQQRARQLVQQLGDDSFAAREQASRELKRLGLAARDVLLEGAKDSDLEVQRRCQILLPAILEADRQERLKAFIADKEGKHEHDLPGLKRFRTVAGSDAAARQLFVDMTKADVGLLRREGRDPQKTGEMCASQCQNLYQRLFQQPGRPALTVADLASLFLVAGDSRVEVPLQSRYMMFNLLHQPAARNALTTSPNVPFKKIVLAWMEAQLNDTNAQQQVFYLLTNLDMKEGVDLALKVLRDKKAAPFTLAGAMTVVGKLGGKEHVNILKGFLEDKTVVGNFMVNRAQGTTQLRDVALAMLVHITGQSHGDYGFVFVHNQPALKFHANFLGFGSDEERNKAQARWKEWSAKQKK